MDVEQVLENLIKLVEGNRYNEALELIKSAGESRTTLCNSIGKKGFSPLQCAAFYSHIDMVNLLLEQNVAIDLPMNTTLRKGVEWYEEGTTALHIACSKRHSDIVEVLLNAGATPDLRNNGAAEQTPLHVASEYGVLNSVKMLIDRGVDINCIDQSGELPLHKAARGGHNPVVMLLITSGSGVNTKNAAGYTPLMQSVSEGHLKTTLIMVENGGDVKVTDPDQNSLLALAVMNQKDDIIPLLLDNNVEINSQNVRGDTALHIACQIANTTMVDMLTETGLDLDIQNNLQQTALHLAALSNSQSAVTQLISAGAKNDIKDSQDRFAAECTTDDSIAALIEKGRISPPPVIREKTMLDLLPPSTANIHSEQRVDNSPNDEYSEDERPVYVDNTSPGATPYQTSPRGTATPISNNQGWRTNGHEKVPDRQRHKPPNRINVMQSTGGSDDVSNGQFKRPIGVDKATVDTLKQKITWLEGQVVTLGIGDDKAVLLYRQLGKLDEELQLARQLVRDYMVQNRPTTPRLEHNKVTSPSTMGLMSPRNGTSPRENGRKFNPNFLVESVEAMKSELQYIRPCVKPTHADKFQRFQDQVESIAIAIVTFAHKMAVTLAL